MYLYKKTYVQNWKHNPPEQQHQIEVKRGGVLREDIKPNRICYITEDVAYWRKFNALHNWFVVNCGGGVDECQTIYVDSSKLEELLGILKKLNADFSKADELLPPTSGFFFGNTEVDEWYKKDVETTITILEDLLEEHKLSVEKYGFYSGEFEYRASW